MHTFDVDHKKLARGVYKTSTVYVGKRDVVTIDMRMRQPYREEVLSNRQMHTLEHMMAVALEKSCGEYNNYWKREKISKLYVGPMGCQTGFYVLLSCESDVTDAGMLEVLRRMCNEMLAMVEVPAGSEARCGNVHTLYKNPNMVKSLVQEILKELKGDTFDQYPRLK